METTKTFNHMFTPEEVLSIINDYDRELKIDTFAYTKGATFTTEDWWDKKLKKLSESKESCESFILTTPIDNIKNFAVVDYDKVEKIFFDKNMDVFTLYHTRHDVTRRDNLSNVSLYEDLIVRGGVKYKILRMLTK